MSRCPLARLVSLAAVGAWPLHALACQYAEIASVATADVEVLRAYIDPGVAGFVIVTVLGFISSIGYWARSHIARAKHWLFGPGETDKDRANAQAGADGSDDGEGGDNC